jgi:RNA polymerase sigma-70 factor (ECF subfamily)
VGTAELSDEAQRAASLLAQLRPEQKHVLELALVHGRTYEQIADTTGMPVGTVKTHARRGLIRVREIIAEGSLDASPKSGGGDA